MGRGKGVGEGHENREQVEMRTVCRQHCLGRQQETCFLPAAADNKLHHKVTFPPIVVVVVTAVCCLPAQLHGDISLFLSHDWPNEITRYGDKARLFRKKPYFQNEVGAWQGQR